jgi:hypothetical protein
MSILMLIRDKLRRPRLTQYSCKWSLLHVALCLSPSSRVYTIKLHFWQSTRSYCSNKKMSHNRISGKVKTQPNTKPLPSVCFKPRTVIISFDTFLNGFQPHDNIHILFLTLGNIPMTNIKLHAVFFLTDIIRCTVEVLYPHNNYKTSTTFL